MNHFTRPLQGLDRRARRQSGGALLEFALTVPIFMALLVGIVGLGWSLYVYDFLASSANQAARYAIVRGAECTSWASACPANAGDIQTYVLSLVPGGINASAVTATATWSPDNAPGSSVKVTVGYSLTLDIPLVGSRTLTFNSSSQMVISQ